jgi:membrane complex biogenesis BtpA family protein
MAMLVGVIHLPALPGSPRSSLTGTECARHAADDARVLAAVGYDAIIVENFGDAPFFATRVPSVTVAAMTACAAAVRDAAPGVPLGLNVLRNDGEAALSIAACVGANFIRVNVLTGARVTDQGVVEGEAALLLRHRRALGADGVKLWADVDVKHSSPLGAPRPLTQEVLDLTHRAMADVVLVTGDGTGKSVDVGMLAEVKRVSQRPVLVASGATIETLSALSSVCDGVVVGSALREGGVAGGRIVAQRASAFHEAFREVFRAD